MQKDNKDFNCFVDTRFYDPKGKKGIPKEQQEQIWKDYWNKMKKTKIIKEPGGKTYLLTISDNSEIIKCTQVDGPSDSRHSLAQRDIEIDGIQYTLYLK